VAKFEAVLVKGHLWRDPSQKFEVVEQGTPDNCGYEIGEIHRPYGREWKVTEILPYSK